MGYQLRRQKNGTPAVYDIAFGETMHPGRGPWEEANRLYVEGGGLIRLLTTPAPAKSPPEAVVFDVGLGAAANALAAVACHEDLRRRKLAVRPLRLISFENEPAALEFALDHASDLSYPRGYEQALEALLSDGRSEPEGGVTWELRLGDFTRLIHEEPARADLIFFDPFSPRSNPAMWSLPALEGLHGCRRPGGLTRLATYSSSFATRAGLLLAGFYAGEGPRMDSRRSTTLAATSFSALEQPLGREWLARWRRERNPWPPLTPPTGYRRLREALLEHSQWSQIPASPSIPGRTVLVRGKGEPRGGTNIQEKQRGTQWGRRRGRGK